MRVMLFEADAVIKSQAVRALHIDKANILKTLQEAVGGNIEALTSPVRRDLICYINENGKQLELPRNARAEAFLRSIGIRLYEWDWISGNMVVCGMLNEQGENDGDEHDVPEDILEGTLEMFEMECRVWGEG